MQGTAAISLPLQQISYGKAVARSNHDWHMPINATPRRRRIRCVLLSALALVCSVGCGGSNDDDRAADALVLDPAQAHYGYTNAQWGTRWWQWFFQLPTQQDAEDCIIPWADSTGEHCAYGQPGGEVFFLAGTTEGATLRYLCVVPSGKAIYFPIVNYSGDNVGVPAEHQHSPQELQATVQDWLASVPVDQLSVEFDGKSIPDLARFRANATEYSYELPPEPNIYTCGEQSGVTGLVEHAYGAGYYVMLAPPPPGAHVLHFKGSAPDIGLHVDVTYKFTIE
jgi:hypothetical protein